MPDFGAECLPAKASEPKNLVEQLPEDASKNDPADASKIIESCQSTSLQQESEDLKDKADVLNGAASEKMKPTLEYRKTSSLVESSGLHREVVMVLPSSKGFGTPHAKISSKNSKLSSEIVSKNNPAYVGQSVQTRKSKSSHQASEGLKDRQALPNSVASEEIKPIPEYAKKSSLVEPSGQHREIVIGLPSSERFGASPAKIFSGNSTPLGGVGKRNPLLNKNHRPRHSVSIERRLRSRLQEIPKEPTSSSNVIDVSTEPIVGQSKRKTSKKKIEKRKDDEYSTIRKNIRYILKKINYEQSLIAAYASEGWKGLSLEKLKPEKELERATKEILRCKLKIRDLFQHLEALSAVGRLPESLFDSEGEISGDDIFCAKCGSEDLSIDNDIILCDGVCDRGFHQYCLEPPLLKEDIPPDDEGWLCPACDCKADCIELLSDIHGTNLSISDSWKTIFPEAAAAEAAGDKNGTNFGVPSDDSDDYDYNPDGHEDNKDDNDNDDEQEAEDESSDESDFTSASDDLLGPSKGDQFMGLPSDDSEDDDYDPGAPHLEEQVKQENSNSSSDFTSDSEDLGAILEDYGPYQQDEIVLPGDSVAQKYRVHGRKKEQVNDGLSNLDSDPGLDGSAGFPKRRSTERLDYKKLYNEAYGNVPSSSSDDEDWAAKGKATREAHSASTETATDNGRERDIEPPKHSVKVNEYTPMRNSSRKVKKKDENTSHEWSTKSSGERSGSSARRLGEAVTQRLLNAFQENRYPDRASKESLARELEIPFGKVNSWFKNMRWSVNHSSRSNGTMVKSVSKEDITPKHKTADSPPTECQNNIAAAGCSRDVRDAELTVTPKSSRQKSTATKSGKRKRR